MDLLGRVVRDLGLQLYGDGLSKEFTTLLVLIETFRLGGFEVFLTICLFIPFALVSGKSLSISSTLMYSLSLECVCFRT